MHKLLQRQLKKTGTKIDEMFLNLVDQAYEDADEDRRLLEHSLTVTSEEVRELYEALESKMQKKLRETEERYERLVHELRDQYLFYAYDKDFILTYISESVTDLLGYEEEDVIGRCFTDFYTDDNINQLSIESLEMLTKGDKVPSRIVSVYHKNGEIRYLEIDSYPVLDENGDFIMAEGIARDITRQFTIQKELDYLSSHDMLTGLTNRYSLTNQLEYIISNSKRNKQRFSLFYIDLDNFKLVNDTFGHDQGDALLKNIARTLKKHVRENDIFARIGGDEFIIIYTDITDADIVHLAQTILQEIKTILTPEQKALQVSASIGISSYPKDGESVDMLLKNADNAMYAIKQQGKSGFGIC
jgi:diguanylate cyclase (GGDEF)-like protein/PAS domain S-box-containing protein